MNSGSIILSWDEAKDKKVKSSDDKDLGKIQNTTKDYIEIKEGKIGKKIYLKNFIFARFRLLLAGYACGPEYHFTEL